MTLSVGAEVNPTRRRSNQGRTTTRTSTRNRAPDRFSGSGALRDFRHRYVRTHTHTTRAHNANTKWAWLNNGRGLCYTGCHVTAISHVLLTILKFTITAWRLELCSRVIRVTCVVGLEHRAVK